MFGPFRASVDALMVDEHMLVAVLTREIREQSRCRLAGIADAVADEQLRCSTGCRTMHSGLPEYCYSAILSASLVQRKSLTRPLPAKDPCRWPSWLSARMLSTITEEQHEKWAWGVTCPLPWLSLDEAWGR